MTYLLGIVGATVVLVGVMLGAYRAAHQIYGYRNDRLFGYVEEERYLLRISGILPSYLLFCGLFSAFGGFLWLVLAQLGRLDVDGMLYGIWAGGVVGILISSVGRIVWRMADAISKQFVSQLLALLVGLGGFLISGWFGAIVAVLATSFVIVVMGDTFRSDDITGVIPGIGWIAGILAGGAASLIALSETLKQMTDDPLKVAALSIFIGIVGGVLIAMMAGFLAVTILAAERGLLWAVSAGLMYLTIMLRFRPIICNHCFRRTEPHHSHYAGGKRFCEHCGKSVEFTRDPGKVVFIFGASDPPLPGRVFRLVNPDFQPRQPRLDVSDVYLDTDTCNPEQVERFLTYIVNTPPVEGLEAITLFYRGELDKLDANLQNALRNTLGTIQSLAW